MNRLLPLILLISYFLLPVISVSAESARVERIVDGDTLVLSGVGTVRLQGIDVPEWQVNKRDAYFERQGIAPEHLRQIAQEARRSLLTLVGETVRIEGREKDRYGRQVVLLWRPDGTLLNQQLLKSGYAVVYRRFDFAEKKKFLVTEKRARQRGVGLWKKRR